MTGEDPLTPDERAYFSSKVGDHDLLMKMHAAIFSKDIGLAAHVWQNTVTLYGDGTKEHPGIVNMIREHIDNQEISDKRRFRNLQLLIALSGILFVIVDRILAFVGFK
jgi:hypothetical protein